MKNAARLVRRHVARRCPVPASGDPCLRGRRPSEPALVQHDDRGTRPVHCVHPDPDRETSSRATLLLGPCRGELPLPVHRPLPATALVQPTPLLSITTLSARRTPPCSSALSPALVSETAPAAARGSPGPGGREVPTGGRANTLVRAPTCAYLARRGLQKITFRRWVHRPQPRGWTRLRCVSPPPHTPRPRAPTAPLLSGSPRVHLLPGWWAAVGRAGAMLQGGRRWLILCNGRCVCAWLLPPPGCVL